MINLHQEQLVDAGTQRYIITRKGATIVSFFLGDEGDYLIYKIESVRQQMIQVAAEKKNFTDKAVVELRAGYLPNGVSEKKECCKTI